MNYYMPVVNVIGCGYAGIECALFLAGHGIKVHVFDIHRDYKCSCNHCTGKIDTLKEKFCKILIKRELDFLGSPLIKEENRLIKEGYPGCIASKVLEYGERLVKNSKNIEYFNAGISQINPREINVIATGSNTDEKMFEYLTEKFGSMRCFRHLQISPIIDNIDIKEFYKRKDNDEFLYLPLDYEEYLTFVNAVIRELNTLNISYNYKFLQNTIEDLACKGKDAIKNYALMPVYLENLERRPYAVMRLYRQGEGYSIEGISSKLCQISQIRILKSLHAFRNINLIRQSDVKDATYLNSRYVVNDYNQSLQDYNLFFAGAILGLNSYYDCIASGLYTAMNVNNYVTGKKMIELPKESLIGRLSRKVISSNLIKRNFSSLNYDVIENQGDFTNPINIDRLYNRSVESLTRFKEVYTNGKYV